MWAPVRRKALTGSWFSRGWGGGSRMVDQHTSWAVTDSCTLIHRATSLADHIDPSTSPRSTTRQAKRCRLPNPSRKVACLRRLTILRIRSVLCIWAARSVRPWSITVMLLPPLRPSLWYLWCYHNYVNMARHDYETWNMKQRALLMEHLRRCA